MRLDDLKKLLGEKKVLDMKPIYDELKESALAGSDCAIFTHVDYHILNANRGRDITEEELEQLKVDGYEVDWREKQVKVSGW